MVTESNWGESHTGPNRPPETLRGVRIFSVKIHPVRWRSPWKVSTSYWALAANAQGPNSQPANRNLWSIAKLVYTSTVDVRAILSLVASSSRNSDFLPPSDDGCEVPNTLFASLRPNPLHFRSRRRICPFVQSRGSSNPNPLSKAPACTCAARLGSAILPISTPFSSSTISATTSPRTTSPASPGTPTAVSRPSRMCSREPSNTATASATTAPSPPATYSG